MMVSSVSLATREGVILGRAGPACGKTAVVEVARPGRVHVALLNDYAERRYLPLPGWFGFYARPGDRMMIDLPESGA